MLTPTQILSISSHANKGFLGKLCLGLAAYCPDVQINSPIRLAHFLAQAAHESDGFRVMEEYASGKAYEGRMDLGNLSPGDGVRYKGRGIFQLTGRANYHSVGGRLGLPLEVHPELAAQPDLAVRIACDYWATRRLRRSTISMNQWADEDNIVNITRIINGGEHGLPSRRAYLVKAKTLLGVPT